MSRRAQRSAPGSRSCLLSLEPLEERELLSGAAPSRDPPTPVPPAAPATTGLTGQPGPTSQTTPDTGSTDADASEYQDTFPDHPDQTSPASVGNSPDEVTPSATAISGTTRAPNRGQAILPGTLSSAQANALASTQPASPYSTSYSALLQAVYSSVPVLLPSTAGTPPPAPAVREGPELAGVAALPAAPPLRVSGPLPPGNAETAGAVAAPSPPREPAEGELAFALQPPTEVVREEHPAPALPVPVDRVLPLALAGLTPQGAPLLAGLLPLDLVPLARSADQFFTHLQELADSGPSWQPAHLATWLAAGVVTTAAYEFTRYLRRRLPLDFVVEGDPRHLTRIRPPGPLPPGDKP